MHYKVCSEIIGGARALMPMEVYAYALISSPPLVPIPFPWKRGSEGITPEIFFQL